MSSIKWISKIEVLVFPSQMIMQISQFSCIAIAYWIVMQQYTLILFKMHFWTQKNHLLKVLAVPICILFNASFNYNLLLCCLILGPLFKQPLNYLKTCVLILLHLSLNCFVHHQKPLMLSNIAFEIFNILKY